MATSTTDIVLNTTEVSPKISTQIASESKLQLPVIQETEQTVEVTKKEYSIVGDGIYIQTGTYEDAPEWIKSAISTSVNLNLNTAYSSLIDNMNSILSVFEGSYVPLDTYTAFVVTQDTAYESLHGLYESLNSNYQTDKLISDARILSIEQTYTTEEQARAYAQEEIASSLVSENGGSIGSTIARVSSTVTGLTDTVANNYTILRSELTKANNTIAARATAIESLDTYVGYTDQNSGLTATLTGALDKISLLEKQVDGVIETISGTYDVVNTTNDLITTAEPYATWLSEGTRLEHTGDTYIKYSTETDGSRTFISAYKFIQTVVDDQSPDLTDEDGFTWALITNTESQEAFIAALNAYDLADNKRRVFINVSTGLNLLFPPTPYDAGDLWLRDDTGFEDQIFRATTTRALGSPDASINDWISINVITNDSGDASLNTMTNLIASYELYVDDNLSYKVDIYSSAGNFFRNGIIESTLTCRLYKGTEEITDNYYPAGFSWVRTSANTISDTTWNNQHIGVGKTINITDADVFGKAVFTCNIDLSQEMV